MLPSSVYGCSSKWRGIHGWTGSALWPAPVLHLFGADGRGVSISQKGASLVEESRQVEGHFANVNLCWAVSLKQKGSSFSICRGYSLQRESKVASVSFLALSMTGGWMLLPHGEPRFEYLGQSWHGCPGRNGNKYSIALFLICFFFLVRFHQLSVGFSFGQLSVIQGHTELDIEMDWAQSGSQTFSLFNRKEAKQRN